MADTVYRSVKLVLQNSTNEMLTVQGVAMLTGQWEAKMAPVQDQTLEEQSAAEWKSISTTVGTGVSGYVRLGSSSGYFTIDWKLPWTGRGNAQIVDAANKSAAIEIDRTYPDHLVVFVNYGSTVVPDPDGS